MGPLPTRFEREDVKTLFDRLVPHYDRFNRYSSLGLDRRWRRSLAERIPNGTRVLDIGTGTGDTALLASQTALRVVGMDFSSAMVETAQQKGMGHGSLEWNVGDAARLPFKNQSFDVLTSSFVLRNLYRLGLVQQSIREAHRVLARGGRWLALDLTRPLNPFMMWGHRIYLGTVLPLVGKSLFGKKWPGAYLKTSIEEFPKSKEILRLLEEVGFNQTEYTPLNGGIAGIFSAVKN